MASMQIKKGSFPVFETAKINLRHNGLLSVLVSAAFLFLIPVAAGTANLDERGCAVPMEMFLSLTGIIMLVPVFQPEQNAEIRDLVFSKQVNPAKIYLIRIGSSLLILAVLIGLFSVYMSLHNCEMTGRLVFGTWADALFLGALGMFTSALCASTVTGYMISAVFYMLNYGMGSRLEYFYLFSMTAGRFAPKIVLAAAGAVLLAAAVFLSAKKFPADMRYLWNVRNKRQ